MTCSCGKPYRTLWQRLSDEYPDEDVRIYAGAVRLWVAHNHGKGAIGGFGKLSEAEQFRWLNRSARMFDLAEAA